MSMSPSSASASASDAASALRAWDQVNKLLSAAQEGDVNRFRGIVQTFDDGQGLGKTIADVKDANGRGALHFAARNGRVEICRYLVEELLVPIDLLDNDGETSLMHAARQGHTETVEYLIEHGADPLAASNEFGTTPLHHAAGTGSVDLIKLLLKKGASVDAPSDAGTPLLWAAGDNRLEAVKALLMHDADPNVATEDGVTALITAAAAGSFDIVDILIKKGADVNVSAGGVTPLHVAADCGDEKIVSCLLQAGANPNSVDDDGVRPLEAAAAKGYRGIVDLLLRVTAPDKAVADWTTDGVLEHAEHVATKPQEAEENRKKDTEGMKQKDGIQVPAIEVSLERRERALQAKARGDEAFKQNKYLLAVDSYTQALDLDPHNALVLANRSLCWIRLGQAEHALTDAKASRELRPDWPKACYREGSALRLLQRFEEAADIFYEGVKLDPENKELVSAFREAVEAGRNFYKTKGSL